MNINCVEHAHLNRQLTHICLSVDCKQRLLCELCLMDHNQRHLLIPIIETNKSCIESSLYSEVLCFLRQNSGVEVNLYEIEDHVHFVIEQFISEITEKLREAKNYLTTQLKSLARQAQENVQYLREQVNRLYNLPEIHSSLLKYRSGTYSIEIINEILKNLAQKIYSDTQIQNIYNYITHNGVNHNYLDIVQLDLQQFHQYKSKVLSHMAKLSDFRQFLPKNCLKLPTKSGANFSWKLLNPFKETQALSVVPVQVKVTKLNLDTVIKCVLDEIRIVQFQTNGKFMSVVHQCSQHDFYLSVEFTHEFLTVFALWSSPEHVQLYSQKMKIRTVLGAAANPIKKILWIDAHRLYSKGSEKCLLTLDTQGILKVTHLIGWEQSNITYGRGIQDLCILPDTKNALKHSLSLDQEHIYDLLVCSYSMMKVRLQVRSLFNNLPLSRIEDQETMEAKLGLTDHCQVHFNVFELSSYEKCYIARKMDINGIDYCLVTLLNNMVTLWDWKTGKVIRMIDASESFGLRFLNTVTEGQTTMILLIGLEGRVHLVNWIKNSILNERFKNATNVQIHCV